jgi:hypothetical protein
MGDYFKTYNKTLKELIDLISNELPKSSLIDTIKRKYTAAVVADRTLLLTETGKEIFVYRDLIAENRWEELINKSWDDNDISGDEDIDSKAIQQLITMLKQIWMNYDSDEKKYIKKLIKVLLTEYTKYLMDRQ